VAGAIVQSAYAVDDSGTGATTVAVTLGSAVTAGNSILVHVGWNDPVDTITISGVSDGSSYASAAAKVRDAVEQQSCEVFIFENHAANTPTITATFSSITPFRRIRAIEVSGTNITSSVDQSTGQAQTTPGTAENAVSSGATSATTNATDFVLGFYHNVGQFDPGTGTLTAGSGYTINGSNVITGVETKSVSATGAQTATFTRSVNVNCITHVVALKETAAAYSRIITPITSVSMGR